MKSISCVIVHSFISKVQNRCHWFTQGCISSKCKDCTIAIQGRMICSIWHVRTRILECHFRNSYLAIVSRILVLPATSTNGNIPHGPTSSPVSLAILAEVAGLIDIVIIVVAELGVHAITTRTRQYFVRFFEVLIWWITCLTLVFFSLWSFQCRILPLGWQGNRFFTGSRGCIWIGDLFRWLSRGSIFFLIIGWFFFQCVLD